MLTGIDGTLAEMMALDIGLKVESDGIMLSHLHRFRPDGSVAGYLRNSKRFGGDPWAYLPNRPFVFAIANDWHTPGDRLVYRSIMQRLSECPSLQDELTAERCAAWSASMEKWSDNMTGGNTGLYLSEGGRLPMEFVAGYRCKDSAAAHSAFMDMQKVAGDALGTFSTGVGGLPDRTRQLGDTTILEWTFVEEAKQGGNSAAAMLEHVYGRQATFQLATLGPQRLIYAISTRPDALAEVIDGDAGRGLSRNPDVRRMTSRMPDDANMYAIADIGQIMQLAQSMAGAMGGAGAYPQGPMNALKNAESPLIGWTLTVRPDSVRGDLCLSIEDARRSVSVIVQMTASQTQSATPAPTPTPRVPAKEK
jgi:hypothetical protein